MVKSEDLKFGFPLFRLEPFDVAEMSAVVPIGQGSAKFFYRTTDATTKVRLFDRYVEDNSSIARV
jgi:hypothetical protein